MRHKKKACDTHLPLITTCSDNLPHSSRVLIVYDDENSSDVSKPKEYEDFSGPYLITSVPTYVCDYHHNESIQLHTGRLAGTRIVFQMMSA